MHDEKVINTIKLVFSKINTARGNLTKDLNENLPDNQKQNVEKWKKFEAFDDIKIDLYLHDDDFGEQLKKLSNIFSEILSEEIENKEYSTAIKEWDIYKEIIRFFQELSDTHKNEKIILPGINTTIADFIALLYEKNQENTKFKQKYDKINAALQKLKEIENDIDLIKKTYFKEYEKQKESETINIEDKKDLIDIQIQSLAEDKQKFQQKYDYYKDKCQNYEITPLNLDANYKKIKSSKNIPDHFKDYTEDQMIEEINTLSSELSKMKKDKTKLDSEIKFIQSNIEKLGQKKVHKLHNKKIEIDTLHTACYKLSKKLSQTYGEYLKNISNEKKNAIDLNDTNQSRYYNELSKYLAKKMDSIIYVGQSYKVNQLDLINEQITMTDGTITKTIYFSDFGTGESQAAFLKGLLETTHADNRKIIALFDEVGMIDETRLSLVTDSLKKLYAEDKLLVGIVVQKGQEGKPEIKSLQ